MYPGTWAQNAPDRAAVIMGESGEVVTYRQLDERSNRLAHLLRSLGLRSGDVVAFFSENSARYHEVVWGIRRVGMYFVTINSHLTSDELSYILEDSGARLLISTEALAEVVAELDGAALPALEHRLLIGGTLDGWTSYDEATASQPATPSLPEFEGDLLQYSSGTTGRPKGIKRELVERPISATGDLTMMFLQAIAFGEKDVYLSPAPLYHTAPVMWSSAVHRAGGTAVVMEKYDAELALRLIEQHTVTHSLMVPTMFVRMLKLAPEVRARFNVSSLKAVIHAAAPCPVDIKRSMIEWWGLIISEFYASSEGAGATFITAADWLDHPGSVGRAMLGTLHVLDDAGTELPAGEDGQIWFEGGPSFRYHNDPVKTAEAINPAGWATVGDVGHTDADGYLYLTDRKAFMIISGGVNIYPQEAEDVLISHPKVMDAAVFGVPNEEFGEEVKAVVQPIDGDAAGPDLEAELIEHCKGRLAAYKCPRSIDFAAELPRSDTGKLYKRQLKDRYWTAE